MQIPVALGNEPLVEAIFEIRFRGESNFASIIPGYLFEHLDKEDKPTITNLSPLEIPRQIRATIPELTYAPIVNLDQRRFRISVGENSIVVSCKLPYPKWPSFKEKIFEVLTKICDIVRDYEIERYSMKFVNIIEANSFEEQIGKIELNLMLNNSNEIGEDLHLVFHQKENDFVHILTIKTNANVKFSEENERNGFMLNVDTIKYCNGLSFEPFIQKMRSDLEVLKLKFKKKFFDCLTNETIKSMEPEYE